MAAGKVLWVKPMEGGTRKEWGNPFSEANGATYAAIPLNFPMESNTLVDHPMGGGGRDWKVGKRNKMELPEYVEGRADNMLLLLSSPWLKKKAHPLQK